MRGISWKDGRGSHWRPSNQTDSSPTARQSQSNDRRSGRAPRPLAERVTFGPHKRRRDEDEDDIGTGEKSTMKKLKVTEEIEQKSLSKGVANKTANDNSTKVKPFNFLGLPRELRDMVYSYIVGKNRECKEPIFNSELSQTRVRQARRWQDHASDRPSTTPILTANRQLHQEALDIRYKQNTFYVTLLQTQPEFAVASSPSNPRTQAIPFGCKVSHIVHLCIGVVIHQGFGIATPGFMQAIDWTVLPKMKALRSVRFFIATRYHANGYFRGGAAPNYNEYIDGNGTYPRGTLPYRQMMRDFIAALPKIAGEIKFGLDKKEERLLFFEPEELDHGNFVGLFEPEFVSGGFLRRTYDEFASLRGVDVECFQEVIEIL